MTYDVKPDEETEESPIDVPVEFDEEIGDSLMNEPIAVEVGI